MIGLTDELKKKFQNYNQDELNEAFINASCNGELEVVKYLLTSPELKDHADIHADDDAGFQWACYHGHLHIVQYLLTSPELQFHADSHADDGLGFQWACEKGYSNVIAYLLSFNGKQCIDFQKTDCNLDWAIKKKLDDVIIAMMKNLQNNNIFEYIECLPKIEAYDVDIYEQVKNIEIESLEVNPTETSLFV